ncbi:nucleoside recognition domain-containing protein [Paenibacillus abyssi]|uniref:Sporulation integral membrane protein YlbJ n=1 Tax=Paenibacillus abyssi TaxID=1340531 RepID=A0A917D4Q8_9BACL|nr:nucleoside recognition domain-containing protein [Paenibacillus abyssi]GGG12732.1 sporulation integral membrane protein YlbJ [Paenibacillus abyssi]
MVRTVILGMISLWLVASIVQQPDEAFHAALQGLSVWWNIVFPGLLPFLVLAELMLAFGAIHALSALLDPIMRRMLGLPGAAAWAIALGWTAGNTAGAEAVALLRKRQAVSRSEGQWLLALSHMPSPMFMLVVIGAGFLHHPPLGAFIAITVWISAMLGGALMLLLPRPARSASSFMIDNRSESLFKRAGRAMMAGRREDGRSFGKVLGDAVTSGVQKLMTIGGLMIVCSLLVRLLQLSLPDHLSFLAFSGLYESHLGAYSASLLSLPLGTPLALAAIAAVLSWGGWSSLLQANSVIAGTDLRFIPFVLARALHAVIAFGMAMLLWKPFQAWLYTNGSSADTYAFHQNLASGSALYAQSPIRLAELPSLWQLLPYSVALLGAITFILVVLSCCVWLFDRRQAA